VPHGLRHTTASLAISADANVKVVQRMLGHATAAMTLDLYGHPLDDDLSGVGRCAGQGNRNYCGITAARRSNSGQCEIATEVIIPVKSHRGGSSVG
jgi:hypothetical protein